jgi:hypothetical protein
LSDEINLQSGEKFMEPGCIIRKRIGYLISDRDTCFNITPETDSEAFCNQIEAYFTNSVLPFLDTFNSHADIIQYLMGDHRSDYIEAQITTLFYHGYADKAKQILDEQLAYRITIVIRKRLEALKQSLFD